MTVMTSSQALCLCHLYTKIIFGRSRGLITVYFLFSWFKKVNFNIYIYIYVILAKKLLSLIICSRDIVFLLITSLKMSSTLKLVFFIISDFLST